ncbi:beta-hexosaminidase [Leptolyngbya valderiana BDU 20041]|nr:beta-hexosaminidase [Leptolyngbya valderiana BDU 20041]
MAAAALYGFQGESLTVDEKAFFRDAEPWGFILFARNIDRPDQVRRLTDSLRDLMGWNAPVFIDQEGGRVQRFKPPVWRAAPPAARFGELWDREPELALEAVGLNHRLLAAELIACGVDADFAPCLDLRIEGAHRVIGDRAFHRDPEAVSAMGGAAVAGLREQGVLGVIKHIPGHGRAMVDSHDELTVVDADEETLRGSDFRAFVGVDNVTMAMTAHVVYPAIDPDDPVTLSSEGVQRIIRGHIGFDGLLMTDDLSMKALDGPIRRSGERAILAGCDLLMHCNGVMEEMIDIAHAAPRLDGRALERAEAALADRGAAADFDPGAGKARLEALFKEAGLEV